MSGESEQEYFADGISEDIITDLSKVSALAVVSRNTAFTYKGKNVSVTQVGRDLRLSHVLEGSVRKSGNRVRITAQLIDARTDEHLWAERYDRDQNDIFALQDEISEAIVKVLKVRLLPEEKKAIESRGTANAKAYQYYLLARQFIAGGAMANRIFEAAMRACERAVELDPDYAQAWAMIARMKARLYFQGKREHDGTAAANRAIELDPKSADAHAVKARLLMNQGSIKEAEEEIGIALALDPDSFEVNAIRAAIHFIAGELREAAPYYERAANLTEWECAQLGMLGTVYHALGDQAALRLASTRLIERAEKTIAREPDNTMAMSWLVGGLATIGEGARAREWIERALIIDPSDFSMRYNFACVLVRDLKDHDAAIGLLEGLPASTFAGSLGWMKSDPDFDPIRGDPRFQKILAAAEAAEANS